MRGAIPDPLRTGTIWLVLDGAVWTSRSVPGIHPLAPRAIKDSRQGPGRLLQWGVPPNGPNRRHNPRRFGPHVRAYASDCEQGARPSLLSLCYRRYVCVASTASPTDALNFAEDATFRPCSGNAPEAVGGSPDGASGLIIPCGNRKS
ncbi:hypothetical protein CMUS01_07890 [Colletotrichum musicola]|uniref:Uncharacterized protein n=1 Tax=Colletotrichum musicola TaxID=2175873 RepID=A0A8H6KFG3_9PEZI|nr:hypothetical protein CMUS01_07890 [Colletotrichum musicola]